jgi:hypothetical protein
MCEVLGAWCPPIEWWLLAVVLVEADDDREKLKLALVETVRLDCSESLETEGLRPRGSWDFDSASLETDGLRAKGS